MRETVRRIGMALVGAILLLLTLTRTAPLAADPPVSQGDVTLEQTVTGSLPRGQSFDYRLILAEASPLELRYSIGVEGDLPLEIHSATVDGPVVASVRNSFAEKVLYAPTLEAGEYYLVLAHDNAALGAISYSLAVSATLHTLPISPAMTPAGGKTSVYAIPVDPDGPLYINVQKNGRVNLTAQLYAGAISGTPISTDTGLYGHLLSTESATVGTYYLVLHAINPAAIATACTITVSREVPLLTQGTPVAGQLTTPTDIQLYRVDAVADLPLYVSLQKDAPWAGYMEIHQGTADGPIVVKTDRAASEDTVMPDQWLEIPTTVAGPYFIRVEPFNRMGVVTDPLTFEIVAYQELPTLGDMGLAVSLPGTQSVRWFNIDSTAGQPLYAFADHNSAGSMRLSLVKGTMAGTVAATRSGAKDLLVYLPQAEAGKYLVKVSESSVMNCTLTGGNHLTTVTGGFPAQGTIINANDRRWFEVPVSAGEIVALHLDKDAKFSTDTPMQNAPANPTFPTGTCLGDGVDILAPTTAKTYFVRVSGEAGTYTLRAERTFTPLTPGQWKSAPAAHAGDEQWFEVTAPAGQPLFIVNDTVKGNDTRILVYPNRLTADPVSFGGTQSTFQYFPPSAQSVRYIIRKTAPLDGFVPDPDERLYAGANLPMLAAGQSVSGTLASVKQRHFYQLAMPSDRPLALQGSIPITLQEALSGKTFNMGTRAAIAGMDTPLIAVVTSATPGGYTLSASDDIVAAGVLYYCNAVMEARIDPTKTTVGRLKYTAGSNVYLGGEGAGAQYLHEPEGADYSTGWRLNYVVADRQSAQLSWTHAASNVSKTMTLRGDSQGIDLVCGLDTPQPITLRNALAIPYAGDGKYYYALPLNGVISNEYTQSGVKALFPSTLGQMTVPTEPWVACWNSGVDEVYGYALGRDYRLGLSTDGVYTVTRLLCPAGKSSYELRIERPRPDPAYSGLAASCQRPLMGIEQRLKTRVVPPESPIEAEVIVRNDGTGPATGIIATVTLPAESAYIADTASDGGTYDEDTRTIIWSLGNLAERGVRSVKYRFTTSADTPIGGYVEHRLTATCAGQIAPTAVNARVEIGGPSLTKVTPGSPGNSAPVMLNLQGACLSANATVLLTQGATTITGQVADVSLDHRVLRANVDLTGKTGAWDATVINPGGSTVTLPGAVHPVSGGRAVFWCEISAPPTLRMNTWAAISLQYGNRGTVDEEGRALILYLPAGGYTLGDVTDDMGRLLAPASEPAAVSGPLVLWLPRVGAGEFREITVNIKPLALRSRATGGLYPQISLLSASLSASQRDDALRTAFAETLLVSPAKRTIMDDAVMQGIAEAMITWNDAPAQQLWPAALNATQLIRADARLAGYLTVSDAETTAAVLDAFTAVLKRGDPYAPLQLKRQYTPSVVDQALAHQKSGPLGFSTVGYLMPDQPLNYVITGRQTAAVAAKEAKLTDTLDTSLDKSTLRLRELTIGGRSVPLGDVTLPCRGYVDLRTDVMTIADILITFDSVNGKLECVVTGYHPVTWTKNDLLLPPGGDPRLSEMSLAYSISPKSGLGGGVQIRNKVSVSLDGGAPVDSNTTVATIDAGPPSSAVQALPTVQEEPDITVRWSGQDDQNGSGLLCYSIFVSDDDGPYTLWKSRVSSTADTYHGVIGHSYRFYSIAEDMLGQVELPPTVADTEIKIGRDTVINRGLRLVSVPVMPSLADPKIMMGFSANRWSRYLPGSGYVSYGDDPDQLTWFTPAATVPGRGYWGYWAQNAAVDPQGEVVSQTQPFTLNLDSGWNLLGNPWTKAVNWNTATITVTADGETKTLAQAAQAGWIDDVAWKWTPAANPDVGQYVMIADSTLPGVAKTLEPWQGFWLKASRACTLTLPPVSGATGAPSRAPQAGWSVQLIATSNSGEDGGNWLGIGDADAIARAKRIASPPTPPTPTVDLALLDADGQRPIALRDAGEKKPVWRLQVTTPVIGEDVTLRWANILALPAGTDLVLIDEQTGKRLSMRGNASYQFTARKDGKPSTFRIETARISPVRIAGMKIENGGIRGGGITVKYVLSRKAPVRLEIRSRAGEVLRTVTGATAASGAIRWDGRDAHGRIMPSGIYLLAFIAGEAGLEVEREARVTWR